MSRLTNTDQVSGTDRQASGNQPDNSTPTGTVSNGSGGPPSGPAGGDLAGTYPNPTLKVIGSAAGPIGDATHVARVTIDAKGRVTALSSVAITAGSGTVTSVAAGQGLVGTPNPIVGTGTIALNDPTINVLDYAGVDPTGATNSDAGIALALADLPVGGPLQRIWVDSPGTGYTVAPTVSISGGGGGTATAIVDDGLLVAILITAGGTYASNPTITFSGGGGGSGATAYAIAGTPCTLYFPPGFYQFTGIALPANVSCLDIIGHGAVLWCTSTNNTCFAYNDSNNLTRIRGFTLRHDFTVWGNNAGSRDPGCGIRLKGRFHHLCDLNIFQSPEFGIEVGDDSSAPLPCRFVIIENVIVENTCGDGIHFQFAQDGLCTGCIVRRSGDDAFAAVCDSGALQYTQRIKFEGCVAEQPYGCGLRFESCLDCDGIGHTVISSRQAGITIASQAGGTCENINLVSCTIRNPNSFDPTIITGRGIVSELSATGVIDTLRIVNCAVSDTQTANGQGIYLSATGGAVIKNVMICGGVFSNIGASAYIFTQNMTVASVIRNNTSLDPAKTQTDSGSAGLVTANNT